MFLCFCQLYNSWRLHTLLVKVVGPYPKAYRASPLRSLRRASADLITGQCTSLPTHAVPHWQAAPFCHKRSDQNGASFLKEEGTALPGTWERHGAFPSVVTSPISPLLSYHTTHTRQKKPPASNVSLQQKGTHPLTTSGAGPSKAALAHTGRPPHKKKAFSTTKIRGR